MEMEMTMQYERGFKLVSVADDNTYWSWSSPATGEVEYKIGEWTMPLQGNGPLAVFDNMDNLLRFTDPGAWHRNRIFEAEYIRSTEHALWIDYKYIHPLERHIPAIGKVTRGDLPTGTVLASRVRLLELSS